MHMQRAHLLTLALIGLLCAVPTRAQQSPPQDLPTPPRLSLIEGQVSFWRPGVEDWVPAHPNTPLANGDSIYTGQASNAELQVGVRVAGTIVIASRPSLSNTSDTIASM